MLYEAFEQILSDNLTSFINNPEVTIRVTELSTGNNAHIQIIRGGEVTADMVYIIECNGIIGRDEFIRCICVDENGNKIEYEFEEEDRKYQDEIIKYLSRIYVEKDLD